MEIIFATLKEWHWTLSVKKKCRYEMKKKPSGAKISVVRQLVQLKVSLKDVVIFANFEEIKKS